MKPVTVPAPRTAVVSAGRPNSSASYGPTGTVNSNEHVVRSLFLPDLPFVLDGSTIAVVPLGSAVAVISPNATGTKMALPPTTWPGVNSPHR